MSICRSGASGEGAEHQSNFSFKPPSPMANLLTWLSLTSPSLLARALLLQILLLPVLRPSATPPPQRALFSSPPASRHSTASFLLFLSLSSRESTSAISGTRTTCYIFQQKDISTTPSSLAPPSSSSSLSDTWPMSSLPLLQKTPSHPSAIFSRVTSSTISESWVSPLVFFLLW